MKKSVQKVIVGKARHVNQAAKRHLANKAMKREVAFTKAYLGK